MIVKASGCAALVVLTGFFVLCARPIQAEIATEPSVADSKSDNAGAAPATTHRHLKHALHPRRIYAPRKSYLTQEKAESDTAGKQPVAAHVVAGDTKSLPDIPPSVANANAQMLLAGAQFSNVVAFPAATATVPTGTEQTASDDSAAMRGDAGTAVAAADQLNDVDRSLRDGGQPTATAPNPPPAQAAATTMTSEASIWDQTSLIGKIFIGFGALLTMASAARLFMA